MSNHFCHLMAAKKLDNLKVNKQTRKSLQDKGKGKINTKSPESKN